jgi:hypothetical protein
VKLLLVGPVKVSLSGVFKLFITRIVLRDKVAVARILVDVGRFVIDGLGVGVSVEVGAGVFEGVTVTVGVSVGVGEGVAVLVGVGVELKEGTRLQPDTWQASTPAQMRLEKTSP